MTTTPPGSRPGSPAPSRRRLPTLLDAGPRRETARRSGEGAVERLRPGVHRTVPPRTGEDGPALDRERRVLARMAAELRARRTEFWFSHTSAALLWGCWTWRLADEVHTVQRRPPDVPQFDRSVRRHWSNHLDPSQTDLLDGVPVTSLVRTAVDCACALPPAQGVVVVDSALRLGASAEDLQDALSSAVGKRGVRTARRVLEVADGVVESPGESIVRWLLVAAGLPSPVAAVEVRTWLGSRWVDLGWPEARVGIEFDGASKYAGRRGGTVLLEEKRRHDALREAGWTLIRVTWADLGDPDLLVARVRAALARGRGVAR